MIFPLKMKLLRAFMNEEISQINKSVWSLSEPI